MTKYLMMAVVLISMGACAEVSDKEKVAQVVGGDRAEARASWWGFDSEDSTRFLQAAINSRVPRLIVDNKGSAWITDRLYCVSDQEIFFEPGVEVLAKSGAFTGRNDALLSLISVTNVTLRGPGATLRMRRSDYDAPPYVKAEWRHLLNIRGSSKVNIFGLTLAESGGDGIYLARGKDGLPCVDIHIKDVICDKHYRQGISVISAENLLIEDTVMRDTAGTPPAAGIDFEPNHAGERLKNCVMRNCLTENNQGTGYEFYLPQLTRASEPLSIRIDNCRSVGDQRGAHVVTGNLEAKAVSGSLVFSKCSFESSRSEAILVRRKPAHGMSLVFEDCVAKNVAANNSQISDVQLSNSADDEYSVGGIQLERLHIQRHEERPWIRWADLFYSSQPVTAITGSVVIETGDQKAELTLSSEWAARTFPARFSIKVPRVQADLTTAKVTDSADGVCKLSSVKLRRRGNYLLFAKAGQEVVMTGRAISVNAARFSFTPLTVRSPSGKIVATVTPTEFKQVVEFHFKAEHEGFHTLQVNVGIHAFELVSANVPVAIDGTKGPAALIACYGPVFVAVPQDTELFAIGVVGGGGNEAVKAVVLDPEGKEVWNKDPVRNMERFIAQDGQGLAGGLWQIRFARPGKGTFEDFSVEAQGVPGYLFLHPARYWSF